MVFFSLSRRSNICCRRRRRWGSVFRQLSKLAAPANVSWQEGDAETGKRVAGAIDCVSSSIYDCECHPITPRDPCALGRGRINLHFGSIEPLPARRTEKARLDRQPVTSAAYRKYRIPIMLDDIALCQLVVTALPVRAHSVV